MCGLDDLEEISMLEAYVQATQCMLIMASKGYFFSSNCIECI